MTSKAEMFGAALGKAIKKTAEKMRGRRAAAKMYRTNLRDVPKVEGLPRDDGWVDMQVQFLIDKKSAGADHVVGWTVLKPGARHENHRHHNCDEFFIVHQRPRPHLYRRRREAVGRRRRDLFAARLLARLQQHVERGRRAGLGLDGRGLDRGLGLRGRSGGAQDERLGRSAHRARHGKAARNARAHGSRPARSRSAGRSASARRPRWSGSRSRRRWSAS